MHRTKLPKMSGKRFEIIFLVMKTKLITESQKLSGTKVAEW